MPRTIAGGGGAAGSRTGGGPPRGGKSSGRARTAATASTSMARGSRAIDLSSVATAVGLSTSAQPSAHRLRAKSAGPTHGFRCRVAIHIPRHPPAVARTTAAP